MIREINENDFNGLMTLYMLLLTCSKEQSTLDFYTRAGYNKNDETAFIQWL